MVSGLLKFWRFVSQIFVIILFRPFGDFFSHASYRVTGSAAGVGEAAGVTVTLAAGENRDPASLSWEKIYQEIQRMRSPE